MSLSSRLSLSLAGATLLALLPTSPAVAGEKFPETIPLPAGSQPEGIAGGPGTTFFAGARVDGAIVTGDLRTGKVKPFVDGQAGRVAVGMQYDAVSRTLWVAGGTTGAITQYDARSGKELFRVVAPAAAQPRFLNDVEVTPGGVYVTDSRNAELLVVPLAADGTPGALQRLPLGGDWEQVVTGSNGRPVNNANGIRVLPTGDLVVVSRGMLYRVPTATGVADRIELSGAPLAAGDGLELDGSTLYVVNGYGGNDVAVVELAADGRSGTATGALTDTDMDRPTTGTVTSEEFLYVVNGRFTTAPMPTATTPYDLVRVTR